MEIEVMISLIGTFLGFLISFLTVTLKLIKNKKVRKTAEQMLILTEQLNNFIQEAEKFSNYSGEEKKNYVLTKINQFSIDNKIYFNSEFITNKIEEIIELTKQVNTKDKKDWL